MVRRLGRHGMHGMRSGRTIRTDPSCNILTKCHSTPRHAAPFQQVSGSGCSAGQGMDAMLARGCTLAMMTVALLAMLAMPSQAELSHRAAAMNGTSATASVLGDLWQTTVRRQRTGARRADGSRRTAVRQRLEHAVRRRWWSGATHSAGLPRVTDRLLAETQQNVTSEASSLEQQYAAVTAQLQAKAALLQSYASQAAAVTQARYGSFARVAQVQLQQAAPSPPGETLALFLKLTSAGDACSMGAMSVTCGVRFVPANGRCRVLAVATLRTFGMRTGLTDASLLPPQRPRSLSRHQ